MFTGSKSLVLLVALAFSGAALADGTITKLAGTGVSAVSGDGQYASGTNGFSSSQYQSVRWNATTGVTEVIVGVSPASINASGTIAGTTKNLPQTYSSPGVMLGGTTTAISLVGPVVTGSANAVSSNDTVVGTSGAYTGVGSVTTAFVWTQSGGMTSLPMPAGVDPTKASTAVGISDDALTIIGRATGDGISIAGTVGIVWNYSVATSAFVPSVLMNGPTTTIVPEVISHNGMFIGGVVARPANDATIPLNLWRWSQAGGYEQFQLVPSGMKSFTLGGISDDGQTMAGTQNTSASAYGTYGIVWNQTSGPSAVFGPGSSNPDFLTNNNVTIPAWWTLPSATYVRSLSADGRTLGGYHKNGANQISPFVIQVTGILPPTVTKTFAPTLITNEQTSTLTITLSNPNAADATLTAPLTDAFPADLVVAATPAASTTCPGGTVIAGAGAASVVLNDGARIPASGSCTVTVPVTSAIAGTYPNTIGAGALQTSAGANANAATATLGVTAVVHNPAATITPNALTLSVEAGAAGSLPLTLGNTGSANLTFNVGEAPAARGKATSYKTAPVAAAAHSAWFANAPTNARGMAVALNDTSISQMADNTPGTTGAACGANDHSSTLDNSWWRRFYFAEHAGVGATAHVLSVTIASGSGAGGPNGVPLSINLYTTPHATTVDTIDTNALTPIGSGTGTIDSGLVTATIPVSGDIDDTVGKDLVVEYHIDGTAGAFLPGANATAETHPTFISSNSCGLSNPAPVSTIGAGNFHLVVIVNTGDAPVCQNPSDVAWLSESPASGTVVPGASSDVTIGADAASLIAGSYSANLCVTTNDPAKPLTAVPVALTVTPAPVTDGLFCNGFEDGQTGTCGN